MTRTLTILLSLTHALWLGGLATLFLLTTAIRKHDVALTRRAASPIFQAFEVYHLVLGGVAIATLFALWRLTAPSRARLLTTVFTGVALTAAVVSAAFILPRLEQIGREGGTGSPAFMAVHFASMICYLTEAAAMLTAGIALPLWIARQRPRSAADAEVSVEAHGEATAVA